MATPQLRLQTAPFLRLGTGTPRIMTDVIVALIPVLAIAVWRFGLGALLLMLSAVAGAVLVEWLTTENRETLKDGSAVLTGLILALTLPPGLPLWMAFLGGVVALGLGKAVFGGLGQNRFNPALVGRAFLQAAFPTAMTTWNSPSQDLLAVPATHLSIPLYQSGVDVISSATPLAQAKFEQHFTALWPLLTGDISGSLGETSALAAIIGGGYMLARRTFDWRIPVSVLLSVALFSTVFWLVDPARYPSPLFMLFAGGLMFGAVYMATDPVSSPMAPKGAWIFGLGIGALVVLIRLFGGLPEGVMYAILLMNAATPLIDRVTQPRPFGRGRGAAHA